MYRLCQSLKGAESDDAPRARMLKKKYNPCYYLHRDYWRWLPLQVPRPCQPQRATSEHLPVAALPPGLPTRRITLLAGLALLRQHLHLNTL